MRGWVLLVCAIMAEVVGTLALRAAVDHTGWIALVIGAYLISFALLGLTLRAGIPIGVAYGIWGAAGVALVALLGSVLFGEALGIMTIIGIIIIIFGVVLVQTGARPKSAVSETKS